MDGAANAEVCRFLAERCGLRPSEVEVLRGERGRDKLVLLHGRPPQRAVAALVNG